ncbi:hypothetical protein TSUD_196660 [Trifolium subterraneum]|uniref:F-box associated beta-propeller type 1 domain-containing protein n=1 Tax=Trifolium subterraneum TaxID=3900 RepID=A0A2Z6PDC2_TRISU|nr:hypothetical protein TSUD_196660 [Trifolium subterraneum]
MFISNSDPYETRFIDFEASLHQDTASASLNLNFMPSQSYSCIEIKGSCRGFLFLYCYLNIYLWNPSNGLHKQIPLSPIDSNLDAKYFCYLYGFGYDQSTDDYLVVLMSYDTTLANISSHLEVFSLRNNSWKEIEGNHLPYMNASDDPRTGSLFNEAIHWLAFREDLSVNLVVAFDLMERKLLEMSLPDDFDHEPTFCDLWVFGDFFSLWAMGDGIVEIWVMKEYRVHSSWAKTLVLPIDGIPTWYFSPLCCTKSGHIVGTDGVTGLAKYDDKGQLLQHRSYCNGRSGSQVIMYTESLLSPPCFLRAAVDMTLSTSLGSGFHEGVLKFSFVACVAL